MRKTSQLIARLIALPLAAAVMLIGAEAVIASPASAAAAVGGLATATVKAPAYTLPAVKIPRNYVYNPRRGSLHDYCTLSPNRWRPRGYRVLDLRGSCAVHDMCYERRGQRKAYCDNQFYDNLKFECDLTYLRMAVPALNKQCRGVAKTYYSAVKAHGHDPR
ncbi:hypothetical protein [Winogradskya humida]|uniref:Phospholipase A2-like protein n=1 Tax=Winogradskya humida TaxID=113566 RepID=A0ABQ3ZU74_9ACTN|nr:hypothetical protein [Actinoplanes humidus]GIE22160.1 hypothetical protein Ahu01nite_052620 [Actinoplanes humidus]